MALIRTCTIVIPPARTPRRRRSAARRERVTATGCRGEPCSVGRRRSTAVFLVSPLAQEALEVACDRLARGNVVGELDRVGLLLLEPVDELLDLGVGGDRPVDLLVEALRGLLQLGGLDRDSRQALRPAQEGERGLRVGDRGDIVRDGGPCLLYTSPSPR